MPYSLGLLGSLESSKKYLCDDKRPDQGRLVISPAAAAPPGMQLPSSGVPIPKPPKPPTGFDIAVTNIGTTGPQGANQNCPIITIGNVGTRAVNGNYKLVYKRNGVLIFTTGVPVVLAPGQTLKTGDSPINAGFAQYGEQAMR